MTGHTSLWRLSRDLHTGLDQVALIVRFYHFDVVKGPRGRMVRNEDVAAVKDLFWVWKTRPTVASVLGRPPRRARKPRPTRKQLRGSPLLF